MFFIVKHSVILCTERGYGVIEIRFEWKFKNQDPPFYFLLYSSFPSSVRDLMPWHFVTISFDTSPCMTIGLKHEVALLLLMTTSLKIWVGLGLSTKCHWHCLVKKLRRLWGVLFSWRYFFYDLTADTTKNGSTWNGVPSMSFVIEHEHATLYGLVLLIITKKLLKL